jgi:HlyD family secretion protein
VRYVIFALVAAAAWACRHETVVETDVVRKRTIISTVSESGTIQPDVEVPIASDVSGEITALYVKEGDYVERGRLLFEIRPDNYRSALEQAQSALNAAKADYANSEAAVAQAAATFIQDSVNYFRNKQLYEQKVLAQQEYEAARLRYQISKSAVESSKQVREAAFYRIKSAEASVSQARDNLTRTRVYASIAGTVTTVNGQVGQRVVGTNLMSGTEVVKIADLSRMEVKVLINENDVVRVEIGDSAEVEVDAYPGRKFKGTVTEVAFAANVAALGQTDRITSYPVMVYLKPESYADLSRGVPFRPGMTAIVNIFTDRVENALSVPIQAVTLEKDSLGKKAREVVFVVQNDGTVEARPVETGNSDDEFIEIKKGVKENEIVAAGPYSTVHKTLKTGMKVVVEKK